MSLPSYPILNDHVALVTGANTGLGFAAAKKLQELGAHVIIAGRNKGKVERAVAELEALDVAGTVEAGLIDLGDLASVRTFAREVLRRHERLDLLLNNAGVMATPEGRTQDGFEFQFGVNFVGHFALTGLLFPLLESTEDARVVTMSSIAHRGASIDFENLRLEKPYDPWVAYGQSKLADLIFALELHQRLRDGGFGLSSLAAHPGISESELVRHLPGSAPPGVVFMPTSQGALPGLVASCSPQANSGEYWGPDGPGETAGEPALAQIDTAALDPEVNQRLWAWAQDATGIVFPM